MAGEFALSKRIELQNDDRDRLVQCYIDVHGPARRSNHPSAPPPPAIVQKVTCASTFPPSSITRSSSLIVTTPSKWEFCHNHDDG